MSDSVDLQNVIRELDEHIAESGWDQPVQLFAIASGSPESESASVADEESLQMLFEPQGIDFSDGPIIDVLRTLEWDSEVLGLAIVAERIISVENSDATDLTTESYSTTQEIRVLAIVMREGATMNAIRYRTHEHSNDLLVGNNLVPELNQALYSSLVID